MWYFKNLFTKVTGLAVLCQHSSVAADLVGPLDNLIVVHLLSRCPPIHVIEITQHTCTFMCVMAINWYMLLLRTIIPLMLIIQVKLEEIIMPQNTCALRKAYFWMRHINVWTYFCVSFGRCPSVLIYFPVCWFIIKWFMIIFHQCLDNPHCEFLVWYWLLSEMFLVDDICVAPNDYQDLEEHMNPFSMPTYITNVLVNPLTNNTNTTNPVIVMVY